MMIRNQTIATVLCLALTLSPAFASFLALPGQPAPAEGPVATVAKKIENMLPGNTSGAGFINVHRIFALYGDLIRQTPQYGQVEQFVAAGFPDPGRDLDQIGISTNLEAMSDSPVGVVFTGTIDKARLLALARSQGLAFTESAYRGTAVYTASLDKNSAQLGFFDESTTVLTVDPTGSHQNTKDMVDALSGRRNSFGAANGFELPSDYLANLSLRLCPELRAQLASVPPRYEPVRHIDFLALSVVAEERTKDARADLAATCDTEQNAAALEQLLGQLLQAYGSQGGTAAECLSKVKVSRTGAVTTISIVISRAEMESWISHGKK